MSRAAVLLPPWPASLVAHPQLRFALAPAIPHLLTLTGRRAQENMYIDEDAGLRAAGKRGHSDSADFPEGQRRRVDAEAEEID